MLPSTVPSPQVAVYRSVIRANLNAGLLYGILIGVYTVVYTGTVQLYKSRKPASATRRVVLLAITTLYLLCIGSLSIQWYNFNKNFVANGIGRETIVGSILDGGSGVTFYAAGEFVSYSVYIVSDGLLIWRCYHVWAGSKRVVVILGALLAAETVFVFALAVVAFLTHSVANSPLESLYLTMLNARVVFLSLAITVIATSLIGYKISSMSNTMLPADRFSHVTTIVVDSAVVYSITLLICAVNQVVPSYRDVGSATSNAGYYLSVLAIYAAGICPTVLVVRAILSSSDREAVHYIHASA